MSVRRSQLKECVSEDFSRGWVTRELCTKASMDLKGSVGERQPESPPPYPHAPPPAGGKEKTHLRKTRQRTGTVLKFCFWHLVPNLCGTDFCLRCEVWINFYFFHSKNSFFQRHPETGNMLIHTLFDFKANNSFNIKDRFIKDLKIN